MKAALSRGSKLMVLGFQFSWLQLFFGFTCLLILLNSCNQSSSGESSARSSVKFQQYYIQGRQLYVQHCSNCHQENGTGLGRIYPPLAKSDYMKNNPTDVICLIKNGKTGEIIVNGKSFIQGMQANPSLTDLEIAEITTYIYNSWEHKRGLVEVSEVSKTLGTCH